MYPLTYGEFESEMWEVLRVPQVIDPPLLATQGKIAVVDRGNKRYQISRI